MMFGAAAGAIISGWLSSLSGRKKSLLISSILFIIGALGSAFSLMPIYLLFRESY